MSKRIGRSNIIGEQGIAHIRRTVLDIGYMFYETGGVEAGIDGYIELRDQRTGEVANLILQVQGRATARERLPAETADSFEWPCTEAEIAYWLHGTAPVLLIVVQTTTNRAYWKSIKEYFRDAAAVQGSRVVFDKRTDVFDRSAKAAISTIAANVRPGAIAPPARIIEGLISNLLPVEAFGPRLYLAETEQKDNKLFGAASRSLVADAQGEWIVKGGRVLSFHDLDSFPWNKLCDVGTIESFDTSEWALTTDPDRQRDFVQLLNRALGQLTRDDLMFDRERRIHYFKRIPDRWRRAFSYDAFEKHTSRNVVGRYAKRNLPTETAYFRHSAFIGRFQRFGDKWYLEITPTYHFTRDGYNEDRFAADHLKKIKEFENNGAVVGQFAMWRYYLVNRAKGNMFGCDYPFLKFGLTLEHPVEQGVPDKLWQSQEPQQHAPLFDENPNE
jgi:hypothetical protein